jgi:hypothetical protein
VVGGAGDLAWICYHPKIFREGGWGKILKLFDANARPRRQKNRENLRGMLIRP